MHGVINILLNYNSEELNELLDVFYNLRKPYGVMEINRFNRVYASVYRNLPLQEKRRAENLVDTILKNLNTPDLANNIFGVVQRSDECTGPLSSGS